MIESQEFTFNKSLARRTIVFLIVSSLILILLLIFTGNKVSNNFSEYREIYLVLLILYSLFILVLLRRLFQSFKGGKINITINDGVVLIPTLLLGVKHISLDEIYSIENIGSECKTLGIILGVKNKGKYLVEKQRFSDSKDLALFSNFIGNHLSETIIPEKKKVLSRISYTRQKSYSISSYLIILIAIGFHIIGTHGTFEYSENMDFLLAGANTKGTFYGFEIFRIASSTFIHSSIFHLLLNVAMLAMFSELLEKVLSYVRFSNLFLFSSMVAVLTSSALSPFDASIGASGGIFGLWGAHTCLKLKYDEYLPGSINAIPLRRLYIILLVEIVLEIFFVDNIDYYNHIGGFIAGFAYMYLAPLGPKLETIDQPVLVEKVLCGGLVAFYIAGLSYFLLLYYALI